VIDILADLVRINSINCAYANGPGEAEVGNYVVTFFLLRAFRPAGNLFSPEEITFWRSFQEEIALAVFFSKRTWIP